MLNNEKFKKSTFGLGSGNNLTVQEDMWREKGSKQCDFMSIQETQKEKN